MGRGSCLQFQSWCLDDSCHFTLFRGIAPVSSLFWRPCQILLVQGQKCSLPSQYTGPGNHSRFRAPGLIYFEVVSYLCNSWAWRLVPCSCQLVSSINYLQVGRMVLIWPLSQLLSIFLVLMLNSRFVCAVIHTSLQIRKYVLTLFSVVF